MDCSSAKVLPLATATVSVVASPSSIEASAAETCHVAVSSSSTVTSADDAVPSV